MNELGPRLARALAQHGPRVAVVDRGRAYLYEQLQARVADVVASLRAAGVAEGTLVALGGERDVLRVADLIALFCVGACPLLVCPRWPAPYRAECARRSGATWSLVAGRLTRSGVVSATSLDRPPLPEGLAYAVYTSGSAGAPKGVLVPHAGLVPVLDAQVQAFGLRPGSRSLFMLGLGFDASLSDLGTALLAGATLVLEDDVACAPVRLTQTLARNAVTYVDLPPAYLTALDERRLPPALTTVVVGGEVPSAHDVRRLAPHVALFNVYGPSEATICTSIARCGADWSRPLIGQPIAGNRYALRGGGTCAAEGYEGELVIEGPGVAFGYLGDHERTRERFVLGPARAFRTGDLLRHTARGEWEFLGRVDRQLKRRGQLVAPEHVEAALLRAGPLAAASVWLSADEQLVATVEPSPLAEVEPKELAQRLLQALHATLPPALVPDRVEVVDALPRGANGKVLHRSLTALAAAAGPGRRREAVEAPGTGAEDPRLALLGALMGASLGCPPLGPDEDFYLRGGDSLRALEVVARAAGGGLWVSAADIVRGRTPRAALAHAGAGVPTGHAREALEARVAAGARALREVPRVRGTSEGDALPATLRGTHVFVTGATGTLGRALLEPLRAAVGAEGRITCLVRRPDALSVRAADGRAPVALVLGDVVLPHFGLSRGTYEPLARDVGAVVHLAAQLSAAAPAAELMAVNVGGTQHALQFALDGRPKGLLHASTLSVFTDASPRPERCTEQDELCDVAGFTSDYAASKWAAERLLRSVGGDAVRATVVRLGLLTGDRAGQGASRGHLRRVIRGLAALRAYPRATEAQLTALRFDVTPVDHAAGASLALFERDLRHGRSETYHLAAGQPVSLAQLLRAMRQEGLTLEAAAWPELCVQAARLGDPDGDAVLAILSLGRLGRDGAVDDPALDLFAATGTHFDLVETQRALLGTPFAPPAPDEALLRRYVRSALT